MRFEGGEQIAKALADMSTRLTKDIARNTLRAAGQPIAAAMSQGAPRGDPAAPNLSDVVIMAARNEVVSGDLAAVAIGPRKGAAHAHLQEFGTVHHGAQPFARPAFDQNLQGSLGIVKSEFWGAIISRGLGSARIAQESSESFAAPSEPTLLGSGGGESRAGTPSTGDD